MILVVDPSSSTPPYEQVRVQVVDAVQRGEWAVGARLPTVRRLAEDLGIAANTVARSYRELEHAGVIETRGRNGSFVAAFGDAQQREARLAADAFARRIRHLGVDPDDAIAFVRASLE